MCPPDIKAIGLLLSCKQIIIIRLMTTNIMGILHIMYGAYISPEEVSRRPQRCMKIVLTAYTIVAQ